MRGKLFLFCAFLLILGIVSADVISINSGGSEGLIINAGRYIEGFFFSENSLPVVWNVVLNSSLGTNRTDENLTVYYQASDADDDSITNITDWRLDGNSVARLNMPFDTRNSQGIVKDYSTYQNNGSLGAGVWANSPTWISDCQVGGCYYFDGVNDYIRSNLSKASFSNEITISFFVKPMGTSSSKGILQFANNLGATNPWIYLRRTNSGSITWYVNGGYRITQSVSDNAYSHIVLTYDGSVWRSYNNGIATGTYTSAVGANPGSYFWIGNGYNGYFNGSIDELQIFDRTLTPLQINEIYEAGLNGHNLERIIFSETNVGDVWQVAITPNDATGDGLTVLSNELEIVNSAPVVSDVVLSSTFGTNRTNENLTVTYLATDPDGDVITNITDWRVDGASINRLNLPFDLNVSQGLVRDYSTYQNNGSLGAGVLANSPTWISDCQIGGCYDFDGVNDYISLSSTVTLTSVSLWADFSSITNVRYFLGASTTGVRYDGSNFLIFNGGSGWTVVPWVKQSGFVHFALIRINSTHYDLYIDGDKIGVGSTGSSGANINIDSIGRRSDGYYFDGPIDNVQFFNRPLTSLQVKEIYEAGLNGHNLERIIFTETNVGDVWQVAVTPNDATLDGLTVLSNELEIINEVPGTPEMYLYSENGQNETDSDLICDVELSEMDGENLNLTLRWYEDNNLIFEYFFNNNYENNSILNFTLLLGNLTTGDVWHCEARSYDGYDYSEWGVSNNVTIVDTTPPLITIISPEETNYSTMNVTYNVSINENAAQCLYNLDYSGNVSMIRINDTYFWYDDNTLGPGPHDLYVYCEDFYGNWNYSFVNFTIENEAAISIYLSDDLSWAVRWNVVELPVFDLDAIGNNLNNATDYYINISAINTLVDLYVRADGDLLTEDLDVIGLGNETFGVSYNDSTVSNVSLQTMSTDYIKIGDSLGGDSIVYMKFYLDAPVGQAAGVYLNQLQFKAVRNGELP